MAASLTTEQQQELLERYGADLDEMAYHAVSMGARRAKWTNKAEHGEVLGEVWAKLAEKGLSADVLDAKGGRAYLWTMTRNTARDLARRVNDYPVDLSGGANGNTANVGPSMGGRLMRTNPDTTTKAPESVVEDMHLDEMLVSMGYHIHGILLGLEGRELDIANLFYLDGLEVAQVADKMAMSSGLVWKLMSGMRKRLGSGEADLRIWREFVYPHARKQPGTAQASEALRRLMK